MLMSGAVGNVIVRVMAEVSLINRLTNEARLHAISDAAMVLLLSEFV